MKLDVHLLRHMTKEDFRILAAVEQGMKNHELVPTVLVMRIAKMNKSLAKKALASCARQKLVWHDSKVYDGYKLTYAGYDHLALKAFANRQSVTAVGPQIGVGKESDIYVVTDQEERALVLKLQRLGRVSFRAIKEKRDYLEHRRSASWLYMSRLGAMKEYAFMKALKQYDFPVPEPVDWNRHAVVMSQIDGHLLNRVGTMDRPEEIYSVLMDIIVRLGRHGLIHCDFNEYNLMIGPKRDITVIDFPQMVSTSHPDAAFYFKRDVDCIRTFFSKRFGFESTEWPDFERDVLSAGRIADVDVISAASGFGFTPEDESALAELAAEQEGDESDDGADGSADGKAEDEDGEDGHPEERSAAAAAAAAGAGAAVADQADEDEDEGEEPPALVPAAATAAAPAAAAAGGADRDEGEQEEDDELDDDEAAAEAASVAAAERRAAADEARAEAESQLDDAYIRARVKARLSRQAMNGTKPKLRRNQQKSKSKGENRAHIADFA